MKNDLILASNSKIRADLLRNAGVSIRVDPAKIDEHSIKNLLFAEKVSHRDIADALAEAKARKISNKHSGFLTLGCDQILSFEGTVFSKPQSKEELCDQLLALNGRKHLLFTAAVLYHSGEPLWRHISAVRLTMREMSDDFVRSYADRNWPELSSSLGGYKIEAEGVRLFSRIEGSHFAILGLPLIELLNHLTVIGYLQT